MRGCDRVKFVDISACYYLSFIGQFVYPVGEERLGLRELKGGNHYFSPIRVSLN